MNSTDDDRTDNNTVRHQYRRLSQEEKDQVEAIKDKGLDLIAFLETIGDSRELSLARTKVEEAVMWGVKHVTR